MNVDFNGISERNKVKFSQTALVLILLLLFIGIVIIINAISVNKLKQKVEIAYLAHSVAQNQMITQDNLVKAEMYAAEFNKIGKVTLSDGSERAAVVRWSDAQSIVGGYAAHYIREGTPIYWDSLTRETSKKNSYLYSMDGELVKLDVSADVFGDMIVPGDKVNIRCIYTENSYKLPTVEGLIAYTKRGLYIYNGVKIDGIDADEIKSYNKLFMRFDVTQIARMLEMFDEASASSRDLEFTFMRWGYTGLSRTIATSDKIDNTQRLVTEVSAATAEQQMGVDSFNTAKEVTEEEMAAIIAENQREVDRDDLLAMFQSAKFVK